MEHVDGSTLGIVLGFLGVVVSTIGGLFVALRTNKSEKTDAAQKTLEATRDEAVEQRLALKDDIINDLKNKVTDLESELATVRQDAHLRVEELENENDEMYRRLQVFTGGDPHGTGE